MTYAPRSPACAAPAGSGTSHTETAGCDGCWLIEGDLAHPLPPKREYINTFRLITLTSIDTFLCRERLLHLKFHIVPAKPRLT